MTAPVRRRWPLRRRLTLVMLAVVTVVLLITVSGFMVMAFRALYTDVDHRLRDAAQAASTQYPFADPTGEHSAVFTDLAVEIVDPTGVTVRVLQRPSHTGPAGPSASDAATAVRTRTPITADHADAAWRLLAAPLPDGTWLLACQPVTNLQTLHSRLVLVWTIAVLVILLVTAVLTTHLVSYGLRPLTDIATTAGRIRAGDLSHRLPVASRDEVGQLAAALNRMLERIEASFTQRQSVEERLRRFVHDAGHELRTPVTAIRGWADLYRGGGITEADLPTAMRRIGDEANRIGALVDQLLLLTSLDQPAHPTDGTDPSGDKAAPAANTRHPVDLAEVVRDAVLDAQAVEPERPLTAELPDPGVAVVAADPMALHQVIASLLDNVRAHTPAGTPAHVHVQRVPATGGDRVVLRIADEGPGVPAQLRDKVFDRFFRADPGRAHRHDGGGAGLGLSIVAAIVANHGGDIRAEPASTGFTIRISLPAAPATSHQRAADPDTRE